MHQFKIQQEGKNSKRAIIFIVVFTFLNVFLISSISSVLAQTPIQSKNLINGLSFSGDNLKQIASKSIEINKVPGILKYTPKLTNLNQNLNESHLLINNIKIDKQSWSSFKLDDYRNFKEYKIQGRVNLGDLDYKVFDIANLSTVESVVFSGKVTTFPILKPDGQNYGHGFARVILIGQDEKGKIREYAVLDTSHFYADKFDNSKNEYDFNMIGDEALALPGSIKPLHLVVEGSNVEVNFEKIYYSTTKTGLDFKQVLNEQNDAKIRMINEKNERFGYHWEAGNTGISQESYEIKKAYLGDTMTGQYDSVKVYKPMPNAEIIYYSGGVFSFVPMGEMTYSLPSRHLEDSGSAMLPSSPTALPADYDKIEFSWRDAHNQDWTTSVKTQVGATCWAYAATAAHELMVNTYFARHLDKDLSEQQFISRGGTTDPICGGQVNPAEQVAYTRGQFDETCFPATGLSTTPCSPCADWDTRAWKSTTYENSINYRNPVDLMKDLRSNAGMVLGLNEWNHAVNLVGAEIWRDDSSLIMEYKNSWGPTWGIDGYGYLYGPIDIAVFNKWGHPETAATGAPTTQLCTDADSDGYCWWGLGSKPSTGCPTSCAGNSVADCDDSDANKQGLVDGYICADNSDVISSCTTINSPGTYYLSGDMSASGNCININSDNVALTCSGATITGTGTGTGIKIDSQSDVRIYDCNLNNFNIGVEILNSDGVMLADSNVSNSNTGFKINGSENVVEKYGILTSNGKGVELINSNNNYIYQNTFQSNTYGIYLTNSLNNEFQGNVIKTSSNTGFYADSASDNNEVGNLYACSSSVKDINDQGTNDYSITACGSATGTTCDYTCSVGCTNLYWPATYPGGDAYYPERIRETSEEGKHYFIIDAYGGTINLCEDGYYPLDYPTQQILLGTYNVVVDFKNSEFVGKTRDYGDYIFDPGVYPPFGNYPLVREDYDAWFSKGTIKNMKISNVSTGIALMGTSGSTITTWDNIHFENVKVGAYARNLKIINSKFINCDEYGIYLYDVEGNQLIVENSEFKNIGINGIYTNAVSTVQVGGTGTTDIEKGNYFENCNKIYLGRGDTTGTDNIRHNVLVDTGLETELENVNFINNKIFNSPYYGLNVSTYSAGTVAVQNNTVCGSIGTRDIYDSSTRGTYLNNACGSSTPSGLCVFTGNTYYRDVDGDGYGNPDTTQTRACPTVGYIWRAGDCDDTDVDVNPEGEEVCDNKDNNCDGTTDNILEDCGSGVCIGTKLCTAGIWGVCSSSGNDAGVCAKCSDTGIAVYDGTQNIDCDDGAYCNGTEVCSAIYTCTAGTPINCSVNNLDPIGMCIWNPDGNPLTWDYFAGFTSACNETTDSCTSGTVELTHTCDVTTCGAECDATHECEDSSCEETYTDYCDGLKLTEYNSNLILDSILISDSCENMCGVDCGCTDCDTDCSAPSTNTYCVKDVCGAVCDSHDDCAPTECTHLSGCVGNDYYEYSNVSNDCTGGCACTSNDCGIPIIYEFDSRCVECMIDDDCNSYDADYCTGNSIMHDEGRCLGYVCETETTETQNCNLLNNNYCLGTDIMQDIYTCSLAVCVIDETNLIENCNDELYCNGAETCADAICTAGTPINCSVNNLDPIGMCIWNPDGNPLTWDYFAGFTSACNETTDSCTSGTVELTHTCDVTTCGAECDATHECEDSSCEETYTDYCDGLKLTEYNSNLILDSILISDSCENMCGVDCGCTDCDTDCSAPSTNTYCVKDVCGAVCDSHDDCAPTECTHLSGCVGNDYYEYSNVSNDCTGGCACTSNDCGIPIIYEFDSRCVECVDLDDEETFLGRVVRSGDSYLINDDIMLCSGTYNFDDTALIANSNNLIIDCNDAELIGQGIRSGYYIDNYYGIEINNKNNVIIKNCHIENFIKGSVINNVQGVQFIDNEFINNTDASIYGEMSINDVLIQGNYIINDPLASSTYGIQLQDVSNSLIIENNVSQNSLGIYLGPDSENNNITNNYLENNFNSGISLTLANNNLINGNNLESNSKGITTSSCSNIDIYNNTNLFSEDVGIEIYQSDLCEVINNTIIDSGFGIKVEMGNDNSILNNNIDGSMQGIKISRTTNNNIEDNIIDINAGYLENAYSIDVSVGTDELYNNCNNIIKRNTDSAGKQIIYFKNDDDIESILPMIIEPITELILCNTDDVVVDGIEIDGSNIDGNTNGVIIESSDNIIFRNSNIINSYIGINIRESKFNYFNLNQINNNNFGIILTMSSENIIENNNICDNEFVDLLIGEASSYNDGDNICNDVIYGSGLELYNTIECSTSCSEARVKFLPPLEKIKDMFGIIENKIKKVIGIKVKLGNGNETSNTKIIEDNQIVDENNGNIIKPKTEDNFVTIKEGVKIEGTEIIFEHQDNNVVLDLEIKETTEQEKLSDGVVVIEEENKEIKESEIGSIIKNKNVEIMPIEVVKKETEMVVGEFMSSFKKDIIEIKPEITSTDILITTKEGVKKIEDLEVDKN
ncbi:MAG: right-handed parallel beta-helix repeat-containing protein [Patescibacteria group bacterium]|nr:right-handed parallel beta-helix repeat-containing protein [Patescibacteria group bacterium]